MAAKDKDEEVTIKRSELDRLLADREAKAKRTPEETAIRSAIREEVSEVVDEKLSSFFDLDGGDGGENDGGDADSGFWGQLAKAFGAGESVK